MTRDPAFNLDTPVSRMSQTLSMTVTPALQIAQARGFSASALPFTMKLAWSRRAVVATLLGNTPERWPFYDRVLCWLEPAYLADVVRYHDFGGGSLVDLRSSEDLAGLDLDHCHVLARRIEGQDPGWINMEQRER